MTKLSITLLVLASVLGGVAYHKHMACLKADEQRFTVNADGTVNVVIYGPEQRRVLSTKTVRNTLVATSALSAVAGTVLLIAAVRRSTGTTA